jgi:hypothetical protein
MTEQWTDATNTLVMSHNYVVPPNSNTYLPGTYSYRDVNNNIQTYQLSYIGPVGNYPAKYLRVRHRGAYLALLPGSRPGNLCRWMLGRPLP